MARFKRVIDNKRDFFNFVAVKYKEQIKDLIQKYGHDTPNYLSSTIWECRIGLRFCFTYNCLKEVIEHYTKELS